ncbi:MAG: hypothetical protein HUJ54_11395 [Erysipelotrichaceae bacterium]|nr:hypothetical protein [Erysipelotrichaceae bacterium]
MKHVHEIDSAVLPVHQNKVPSYSFSKYAFEKLKGDNKKFITQKESSHAGFHDHEDRISFDEITDYFKQGLLS